MSHFATYSEICKVYARVHHSKLQKFVSKIGNISETLTRIQHHLAKKRIRREISNAWASAALGRFVEVEVRDRRGLRVGDLDPGSVECADELRLRAAPGPARVEVAEPGRS